MPARAKKGQEEPFVKVEEPTYGFNCRRYFNRFGVEEISGAKIVTFATEIGKTIVDPPFSCAISLQGLESAKDSILEYLPRTGELGISEDFKIALRPAGPIDLANLLSMAFAGELAETLLMNFSQKAVVQSHRTGTRSVQSDPVALLRSPIAVQQTLIQALYHG